MDKPTLKQWFEYNTVPILNALKVEEKRIQELHKGRRLRNLYDSAELHGRMEGIRFVMGLMQEQGQAERFIERHPHIQSEIERYENL